jgi:hypothetical protein
MTKSPRTVPQLADLALDIQNASNLRAVARELVKVVDELEEQGVDARSSAPAILVGDKIASLLGIQNLGHSRVMAAFSDAKKLAGRR